MPAPIDAGSIYSDVRVRLDKLSGDIKAVQTQFDKLGGDVAKTNEKTAKSFDQVGLAGTAAIGAVTLAFKKSLSIFAQTEQSLANVAAVSGATAAEFKELEDAANEAGTTTRFTASQAADALFFLSSAGLDATQSVAALNGVLELAGATGSDLATASQAVTATLSQFSLAAEDSSRVSNVFAAANANSQATLEKLQNALRQVGPVAGQLGISLEEVTGSLQALFNAGFKGETAGVALRNALADLANESSTAVGKLEALGVSAESVNPEIVGLTGAIGTLERAGLTTAQALDVFGKEAGPALLSLLKTGESGLVDFTEAVTDTNEAARQYAVQNDTLAGSFDSFKSAAEGASNQLIGQLSPILRGLLDIVAGLLRVVAGLPDPLKGIGVGAGVAAGGFIALSKALALVGVTLSSGPLAIVAGVGALVVGMTSLIKRSQELRAQKLDEEFGDIAESLGKSGEELDEFVQKAELIDGALVRGFGQNVEQTTEQVKALAENLELTREEVIEIGLASENVLDTQKEQLQIIKDQLAEQQIQEQLELDKAASELARASGETARLEIERARVESLREQARLAQEQADREREALERAQALEALRERLLLLDELAQGGAISEIELLEEKIAIRQSEIDLLIQQALASGTVTDQLLADIAIQRRAIEGYQERLNILNDEREKDSEETTGKVAEDEADLLSQREALEDQWFSRYVKGSDDRLAVLEFEKNQALAEARELGASTVAIEEFYAREEKRIKKELEDSKTQTELDALAERQAANLGYLNQISGIIESTLSGLDSLYQAQTNKQIARINNELDSELSAIDELGLAEEEADRRKQAAQEAADKRIANLEYEQALRSYNLQRAQAIIGAANAIIQGYAQLGPIGGSIAAIGTGIATGIELATIEANKPDPPSFQTGGIVLPSPGGTLARVAENGSPELLLNGGVSGQALLGEFANQIADRIGGAGQLPQTIRLEVSIPLDGRVIAKKTVDVINTGAAGQISRRRAIIE